jgi:site-specific recombinase XerC
MIQKTITKTGRQLAETSQLILPAVIDQAGPDARRRFVEFFTANIRNSNTRAAYARGVSQFCAWLDERAIGLAEVSPVIVAAYIGHHPLAAPTVKQHLAAIRMLFDYLVTGQVVPMNPAASVRGPKYVIKKGKTPVLCAADARMLLDPIKLTSIVGLRDRALIGMMVYSHPAALSTMPILRTPFGMRDSNNRDTPFIVAEDDLEWKSGDATTSMSIIEASEAFRIGND